MMDMERLNFGGKAMEIAEEEFEACVSDELSDELYDRWRQEGSVRNTGAWIRKQLPELFQAVGPRPRWVRPDCPQWAYHNSRPMVFLGQLDLPRFTLPTGEVSAPESIYIFGAAEPTLDSPGQWTFVKKIVDQCEL